MLSAETIAYVLPHAAADTSTPQIVSSEFRGGAASRLLRGSLVATLPGLSYQHTSAETLGQDTVQGAGKEALNSSSWRGTAFSGAASVGAWPCDRSLSC